MVSEVLYTISELKSIIKEGNEFKPNIGKNVTNNNASNQEKAVTSIKKETEKMIKKVDKKSTSKNEYDVDYNKTTLDLDFDYEPSDSYKERVKAQVQGFPSKQNQDSTDAKKNDSLEYKGNEDFYKNVSDKSKKVNKKETELKHSGLTARTKSKKEFENNTLFKDNKTNEHTMKRLHFKNTRFLSESQMLSKVPEDYKVDGNTFLMKDSTGAEFIVECTVDDRFNFAQFNVVKKPSKTAINEEFKRMEKLYEYKSSEYNTGTDYNSRKSEDSNVAQMLDIMKNLKSQK